MAIHKRINKIKISAMTGMKARRIAR